MVEAGAAASSLSKLDILVAQLESIVASSNAQAPDPLMCFDLLSDLLSSLQEHSKETVLGCQRKCEDALQSLLLLGARPPVRRLAAKALIQIIEKGDSISVYSRASSLQGWLSEMKKVDASSYIGAAHCLGALYRSYGQRITSGLPETSNIVVKLLKFSEVPVRQAALQLLQDALEGSGGGGSASAYSEALRAVLRIGAVDKSSVVRTAAAGCLRACALAGGPGLGAGGLENCAALCVKALEDPSQSVRDAYAAALGSLLALGLNPDAQIQPRGKSQLTPSKTLEGGLQKYLVGPFMRATGPLYRDIRVGLTMAWVAFLQGMHLTYGHSDMELQNYALQAMGMLTFNSKSQIDAHSQACVLYILRVGVVEQMSEATQKEFLVLLTKQLSVADTSSSMLVVILRTISHLLGILGEVPSTAREALENCLMVALSNSTMAVRVETALTIRALAEVDSSCANSMMSFGVTTLRALRETVVIEKGERLRDELDSLHGHALMLAALSVASAKLPLGVPSRLPAAILELAKRMVSENGSNPFSAGVEKEAGWLLVGAVVSSLTKEEIKEQEFDIIALWTIPFGGNTESRLKKAEENLAPEIRVWSAAVEALTSFVKSYVIPHLSSEKEGILLQPILGYLTGALTYLSSPLLQRASNELKQVVDVFTVRTLAAYQALPDPFCYKADHNILLNLCAGPFRDPSLWGGSSSLRQLLDCRDASLGPWIPGRDSSEDELRAFEGGSDGPLPCVWENNVCVFPQPLSVATLLVNEMMLCFGLVFTAQRESKKMVYLDLMETSIRSSKKQSWQEMATTNICVALLAALKVSLGIRATQYEPDIFRRFQSIFQGILAEETSTVPHRRAAAEGLGILARLGNDVFAARLMRSLLTEAASASDIYLRGCIAFACGCIHRSKGGMALSVLVPATVQTICTIAKDPKDSLHIWSLHGLWLTIEAAGLAYVPFVQATMSLAMDILLSEEHAGPELQQCLGRLVNAIIAVTGPELSPGSSFFSRCKSVVAEMSSGNEPAALLESVLFTQQLVLFAPQAVSVHTHVQTLTATLSSRQPSLRQAAVSTLRHLAERDPKSVIEEHIEENLFAMLDTETDPGIISLVRLTLLRLLEAACPSCPSRWLHLCRNVVLAASNTISAGGRVGGSNGDYRNAVEVSSKDEAFVDDEEGMISRPEKSNMEGSSSSSFGSIESKSKEGEQLPRYSTRLFAAECLSRLITAVGDDPRHFNLFLVKEDHTHSKHKGDWLVLQLGQLVALSYQVATGVFESLRPKGVTILVTILQKFGETEDPDFSGHLLLEQYQAQFISAVRTALDYSAGPELLEAGLQLAARIITSGISNGDVGVFRRIITLLSHLLHDFEELQYPSYAESVGCKVQSSLLGAYAAVKCYAHNCISEASNKKKEGTALLELLGKDSNKLRDFWVGLLKDFTVLRVSTSSQWQLKYKPFLGGLLLPAVATTIKPYLDEMWPAVLEAVTTDAIPCPSEKESPLSLKHQVCLSSADFCQLWALSHLIMCQGNKQGSWKGFTRSSFSGTSFKASQVGITPGISDSQIIALHAMLSLCKDGFYGASMLSSDLCKELFQVLFAVCLKTQMTAAVHVMPVLKQVLKYSPDEYVKCDDSVFSATEICVFYIHQVLCSYVAQIGSFLEVDSVMGLIFETLEIVVQRTAFERKSQLLPMFLCLGVKFIILAPSATSSLTVAVSFVSNLALLLANLAVDQRMSTMESVVQSLVECCNDCISKVNVEGKSMKDMDDSTSKLSKILYLLMDFARICIEISGSIDTSENIAQKSILIQCIGSLHCTLTATHREIQLAGLQTLRNVAQTSMAEDKQGPSYELTLLLMQELGAAVVGIVYDLVKAPLTAKAAIAVGESLKLLVLLHSLVKSEESQQEILHVLLPAIITAASADGKGETQVGGSLRTVAVKLVTHLASQPESAMQFKSVLVNMPVELRQKLQDIVRASISQSSSAESIASASLPPGAAPKLVIPIPTVNPSPQPAESSVVPSSDNSYHDDDDDDDHYDDKHDDEDDDWDDFQSYPVSEIPLVHTEGGKQMSEESESALDEEPMDATEVQDETIPGGQIEFEEARSDHAHTTFANSHTHADHFEGGLPSELSLLPGPTSDSAEEAVQESRRQDEAVDISSESNPSGSNSTDKSLPGDTSAENGEEGLPSGQGLLPRPTTDSPEEAVQESRREDEAVYDPSDSNPTGSNSTDKSLPEGTSAENDVENLRTSNEAQEVD